MVHVTKSCIPCQWVSEISSCQHMDEYCHVADLRLLDLPVTVEFCLTECAFIPVQWLALNHDNDALVRFQLQWIAPGLENQTCSQHKILRVQFRFWNIFAYFVILFTLSRSFTMHRNGPFSSNISYRWRNASFAFRCGSIQQNSKCLTHWDYEGQIY